MHYSLIGKIRLHFIDSDLLYRCFTVHSLNIFVEIKYLLFSMHI
jgi:hypothetical protein